MYELPQRINQKRFEVYIDAGNFNIQLIDCIHNRKAYSDPGWNFEIRFKVWHRVYLVSTTENPNFKTAGTPSKGQLIF